jgi:hypothetical protein
MEEQTMMFSISEFLPVIFPNPEKEPWRSLSLTPDGKSWVEETGMVAPSEIVLTEEEFIWRFGVIGVDLRVLPEDV